MAQWRKSTQWKHAMVAKLLKRDGNPCWLCRRPLAREVKRPTKRISIEHLVPRSIGGGDCEANLVLCHDHCNRHLADRPLAAKLKIQAKWHKMVKRKRKGAAAKAGA